MSLGRRKLDGESLGKLAWDFDIGKFVLEDRVFANGGWEPQQQNIENNKFRAVFDLQTVEVGWIAYIKGEGLNAKLVRLGGDYGDQPTDRHNEGFRLPVKMDSSLGGAVREFISTFRSLWAALSRLHDDYLAGVGKHPDCLPAVDVADVVKEPTKKGSLLVPRYKISGWVPRPPDLPAAGIPLVRRAKKASGDAATASFDPPF
jgi:hypothetical protein